MVPQANAVEAAAVGEIAVYGIRHLRELADHLTGGAKLQRTSINIEEKFQKRVSGDGPDFADIHGQKIVKRAAEIAASGMHNLLISGPPGSGKSMTAKCIPSILPLLTLEESLEVSRIHSVAGTLPGEGILTSRPFRMPHHTVSASALAGGGVVPHPGEISLAHRGVLYLDELPEFQKRRWRSFGSRWRTRRYGSQGAVELTYFLRISCLWHRGIPVNAGIIQTENAVPAGREYAALSVENQPAAA